MNHECRGDTFTRWGRKYGRCLMGGDVFELFEGLEFCPACDRAFMPAQGMKDWDPSKDANVAMEIDIPHYKRALDQKTRKVKILDEELASLRALNVENMKRLKAAERPG